MKKFGLIACTVACITQGFTMDGQGYFDIKGHFEIDAGNNMKGNQIVQMQWKITETSCILTQVTATDTYNDTCIDLIIPAVIDGKHVVIRGSTKLDYQLGYNKSVFQNLANLHPGLRPRSPTNLRLNIFFKLRGNGNDKVIFSENCAHLFADSLAIRTIDFEAVDTTNVKNMAFMLQGCKNLTTLHYVSSLNTANVTDMKGMFNYCSQLQQINPRKLLNFDTSKVTDMSKMFEGCWMLEVLTLGGKFDTSNVTDMYKMFCFCYKLRFLNFGKKFNTESVNNMSAMFQDCQELQKLQLDKFDTSNVTDMSSMFACCGWLTSLNLSRFNTQNVTNMAFMFSQCRALLELQLRNFETQKVTDMHGMFYGCEQLCALDISSFDTRNVLDMSEMFAGDETLSKLKIGKNFSIQKKCNMVGMATWLPEQTQQELQRQLKGCAVNFITPKNNIHKNSDDDEKNAKNNDYSFFN